jgi:hypothetical protein
MSRTFWLASYPKSGNTWFRMLLNALALKDGESFDINALRRRDGIASGRAPFDHLTLVESGLLTFEEADRLRPAFYRAQAHENWDEDEDDDSLSGVRFVKVHDAYTRLPDGEPLLGGREAAEGAIVIVRDPRDLAASVANHNGVSIDRAIAQIGNAKAALASGTKQQDLQLRHSLLDWSSHVASWLDQPDLPVHWMRYEDMRRDPVRHFAEALAFAGLTLPEAELARAVATADFDALRSQEAEKGFVEAAGKTNPRPFFRRGRAGGWRDELSAEQVARIEAKHADMMRRLGYEPVGGNEAGESS